MWVSGVGVVNIPASLILCSDLPHVLGLRLSLVTSVHRILPLDGPVLSRPEI